MTENNPKFHTVVMPANPPWVVVVVLALLRHFGPRHGFPGIDDELDLKFIVGPPPPDIAEQAALAEQKGILHLCTGGGRWPRYSRDLAGEVADELNLSDRERRSLHHLLKYTKRVTAQAKEAKEDTDPEERSFFHMAEAFRCILEDDPSDPGFAIEWAEDYIQAWIRKQEGFFNRGSAALEAARKETFGLSARDEPLVLVIAQTPHIELKRYAFSRHGRNAAALVQRQPDGKTNVFLNHVVADQNGLSLDRVAALLRAAEIEAKGITPPDIELLMGEGWVSDAPNWRYIPSVSAIFDGERGTDDHTALSLGGVAKVVKQELAVQAANALIAANNPAPAVPAASA